MKNAVGVLGGVGPLATVYFMEMIIEMTDASKDQEHIDMLVSNHATIPDRTGFILGESSESPMDAMVEDAQMLETAGCSFVVIPCNTAHYFFEDIRNSVQIPVLNIIEETIDYAKKQGSQRKVPREIKKLGILATEGTISSGTYSFYGKPAGVECVADAEAPEGWTKWKIPGYEYLCAEVENENTFSEVLDYLRDNQIPLVGAVQDFSCPVSGKDYMLFPIRKL